MAAEMLGAGTVVFDAMPSVGRKFLLAGKGGLNLTHSEPLEDLLARFGSPAVADYVRSFGPAELRAWAEGLGVETFVGSSGRVFPRSMKAAPLLRTWLSRLRAAGVEFRMRSRWLGFSPEGLVFDGFTVQAEVVVLALGGGSWPKLGSTGAWVPVLAAAGVPVRPLEPSNVGYSVEWSEVFASRFAGAPVKSVALSCEEERREGEFVVTSYGVEGSLLYGFSPLLRKGAAVTLDLAPGKKLARLEEALRERGSRSWTEYVRRKAGLEGVKAGLLRELAGPLEGDALARAVKALPLPLGAPRPLAEAISSAGGVEFAGLAEGLMLKARPGVFCCGEMLDWEAPTGGYLLTACFATGRAAGEAAREWLDRPR